MRLGEGGLAPATVAGTRVVLDVRPLQDPDRAPVTAAYLQGLLGAYARVPLPGESFVVLMDIGGDDPMAAYGTLPIVSRRPLPRTRVFRSGALTLDPFFVRGAAIGTAWGVADGAPGAVAHAASGALPIGSRLPVVATLLDLAPWEMPDRYQRSAAARFGQRLRAQLLRDAAAVVVGTDAIARAATRLLRIRPSRVRVVRLAGGDLFAPLSLEGTETGDAQRAALAADLDRLGVPSRYLVYAGRHDARHDLGTLLDALARLAAAGRPPRLARAVPWPPQIVLVGATPDDRAAAAAAAAARGVGDLVHDAPDLAAERAALLVAGARSAVLPVASDAAGLAALDALAAGTPVVASAVGALPEVVGAAGLVVEPRDPDRLANALQAAWADDRVHRTIAHAAAARAGSERRTWDDVAADTRAVYAEVAAAGRSPVRAA